MSGEMVFTVSGSSATVAQPISLADAGLTERGHLQEWVLAHPEMLGPDVKVVAFEFGRWTAASGALARDRLDVLGLDRDGRLVVVELKRDQAPDTVDMQALKYAALVSRFTRDDLARVHAQYLTRQRGEVVAAETGAAELEEWATLTEESLRLPRLILLAADFPATVTATVVFLHQQLGLEVQLRKFQAYRTAQETLVTVSQLYPPPDVEEFVLSPEVSEQRLERTERQRRQREATTVSRLVEAGALEPGDRLQFRAPSAERRATGAVGAMAGRQAGTAVGQLAGRYRPVTPMGGQRAIVLADRAGQAHPRGGCRPAGRAHSGAAVLAGSRGPVAGRDRANAAAQRRGRSRPAPGPASS
jgi:hypothetical protein